MLVFARPRLVLLSVPKTGTTALEAALSDDADLVLRNPPHLKHLPLKGYQNRIAPLFNDNGAPFRVIAVVRDPVDRLRSWYRYRNRDDLVGRPASTRGLSFHDFVAEVMKPGDRAPYARIGTQADFLADKDGRLGADLVYRYENMGDLTRYLADQLGRTVDLDWLNASPDADTPLSAAAEAALRDHLAEDCALHAGATGHADR
ncbi:sulfotransferase family protein [Paracoccus sp. M683]|uniref:sulfotransferase family 2 domain-containing protein n=1 Tax=Paracoccus sp. M683 TaxID=2594268 RepID=UPI00117F348E|nr:sulfotransferase family 2 domain-containing protein [Paracoccus sp. M683]TRW96303.1 sulfotransferase family protein [Paracoccus sp. M683]